MTVHVSILSDGVDKSPAHIAIALKGPFGGGLPQFGHRNVDLRAVALCAGMRGPRPRPRIGSCEVMVPVAMGNPTIDEMTIL